MRCIGTTLGLGSVIYLTSFSSAYAYLDPGTGSMLIQGVIGAIVGGWVAARLYWGKLRDFFASRSAKGLPKGNAADSRDPQ
ncbi:MAG TPA: hypothetical protein VD995_14775 [Azospirillum sp.]|nr:hypothetical protein [Azospirillum sp.]